MSLAFIDLNDSDIRCRTTEGILVSEPGFATLAGKSFITGASARARCWLEPHLSFNQYWQQLSLTPIAKKSGDAGYRHTADIAFAQLQQIWTECGQPEDLVFAVPSSLGNEQLGVLAGLAAALPGHITGVVDAAVAAVAATPSPKGDIFHCDIQLHQTVFTALRGEKGGLRRTAYQVFPQLGLLSVYNTLTRQLSDTLIRQYRFDPLLDAGNEQYLFDRAAGWVSALSAQSDIPLEIPRGQDRLSVRLEREELRGRLRERIAPLLNLLNQPEVKAGRLFFTDRLALLPTIADGAPEFETLDTDATLAGCEFNLPHIHGGGEHLRRVTSLQLSAVDKKRGKPGSRRVPLATHLLYHHRVFDLDQGVSLHLNGAGFSATPGVDSGAAVVIRRRGTELDLEQRADVQLSIHTPGQLVPGQVIRVGDAVLTLVDMARVGDD